MDIARYFKRLRHDEKHHLGMGDIRITIAQQNEIVDAARTQGEQKKPLTCEEFLKMKRRVAKEFQKLHPSL